MASAERVSVSVPAPSEPLQKGIDLLEPATKLGPTPEHLALFSRGLLTKGLKNGHNTREYQEAAFDVLGHTDFSNKRNLRRVAKLLGALDVALRRTPAPPGRDLRDLRDDELASSILQPGKKAA